MIVKTLASGEVLHHYKKALVLAFPERRRICSTGLDMGGVREDVTAVFNHDGNPGPGCEFELKADTYEEHLAVVAGELGLDPNHTTGMCTAASMDNVAICEETFEGLSVTAIVTGGIDLNGGRIGDPACYGQRLGTINIMLAISADLPEGALVRAMVSCTEAKTAALQELLAPSRFSTGIATGSGTDSAVVICDPNAALHLTDAGTHSKLGELIGRTVKNAVKEALEKQTGMNAVYQFDMIHRMDRFGISSDRLWELYCAKANHAGVQRMEFENRIDHLRNNSDAVVYTSLYAHLLDQMEWGLLSRNLAYPAGKEILKKAFSEIAHFVEECAEEDMIRLYENCLLEWLMQTEL